MGQFRWMLPKTGQLSHRMSFCRPMPPSKEAAFPRKRNYPCSTKTSNRGTKEVLMLALEIGTLFRQFTFNEAMFTDSFNDT